MVILGVSGTRGGATEQQLVLLAGLIAGPDVTEVHHGCCVGVDLSAHKTAFERGKRITVHPPLDTSRKADLSGYLSPLVTFVEARPFMVRNDNIVAACGILVAVPGTAKEVLASGTWATVRRARRAGMTEDNGRLVILRP